MREDLETCRIVVVKLLPLENRTEEGERYES